MDLCLPHCSRGTVRIVAYVLRQTLGWLDAQGNPIRQEIVVPYRDLIAKAGVSRGAIAAALQEAVEKRFLIRVQSGRAKSVGVNAQSASYQLRWDAAGEYAKHLDQFQGFYAGGGHRTPIPNAFFDAIVAREPLAVVKVVGAVLRHTIGYQNQFGGRRTSAPLAYSYIAKYAQLSLGRVLNQAIHAALDAGYIECVEPGGFGPQQEHRSPAQYAIRWLEQVALSGRPRQRSSQACSVMSTRLDASSTVKVFLATAENGEVSSKKPSADVEQIHRSKKTIGNGSEKPAAHQFKKAIKEKTTANNIHKQQAAANFQTAVTLLRQQGMDVITAKILAAAHDLPVIQQQIDWLDARNPTENRVGMLRKAIQENWPKPQSVVQKEQQRQRRERDRRQSVAQAREDAVLSQAKQERQQRKQRLLEEWNAASLADREQWIQLAVQREASHMLADMLRRESAKSSAPRMQVLDVIARERKLPPVAQVSRSDTEVAA
ncbi:MAG: hypothetical protein R3C18_06925 [Planctomycetaceae bacterium]